MPSLFFEDELQELYLSSELLETYASRCFHNCSFSDLIWVIIDCMNGATTSEMKMHQLLAPDMTLITMKDMEWGYSSTD